jgi:putative ABC transport system permease protein
MMILKSHFQIARRSLLARKSNTFINILGLVIGIASALVILAVVRYERSFDTFHSDSDRIYRIVRAGGDDRSELRTGVALPVPAALQEEIPGLERITAMYYLGSADFDVLAADGNAENTFQEKSGCVYATPSFFKVFDFKDAGFRWLAGNADRALAEPLSIVLTRGQAKKYFGNEDPMGRTIRLNKSYNCKVTGVIEDLPPNTDLPFNMLVSYSSIVHTLTGPEAFTDWEGVHDVHQAYLVLPDGATKEGIEKQMAAVHAAHTTKELHESRHYLLQSLGDLHHDPRFGNFSGRTITRSTLLALSLIAAFLLLTGCINYVNLATAQSILRGKEVGLRKVMGSNRTTLMAQFLTETFVVVFIAGVLALGAADLMYAHLHNMLNIKTSAHVFTDRHTLLSLATIIAVVTLLAGLYPAMIISGYNPVSALKNSFSTERLGGFGLRKVLVVLQFTITQVLVVGTFIVVSQMRFFRNVDMGFSTQAIVTMNIPSQNREQLNTLSDQLRAQAFVSNVSYSFTLPSGLTRHRRYPDIGKRDATAMRDYVGYEYSSIDTAYLRLYGIKLLAGRNLNMSDTASNSILINKALCKALGLGTPESAVGQQLKTMGKLVTVAGVVDDFYSNSLKERVDNIVMTLEPKEYYFMSIKLQTAGNTMAMPDAVAAIEKIWTAAFPGRVFEYEYFEKNIGAFYAQENKYATLLQLFSAVILAIGCLGLYGLITFVVNRKGKEVAIRKVLGATLAHILAMFSREYIRLIMISFIIATPIAYYAANSWLSTFANHIALSSWLFIIPGLSVLVIALFVITTKSITAARANPVDSLKHE